MFFFMSITSRNKSIFLFVKEIGFLTKITCVIPTITAAAQGNCKNRSIEGHSYHLPQCATIYHFAFTAFLSMPFLICGTTGHL